MGHFVKTTHGNKNILPLGSLCVCVCSLALQARRLEDTLYRIAPNKEDYEDLNSLKNRLQQVTTKTEKLLFLLQNLRKKLHIVKFFEFNNKIIKFVGC